MSSNRGNINDIICLFVTCLKWLPMEAYFCYYLLDTLFGLVKSLCGFVSYFCRLSDYYVDLSEKKLSQLVSYHLFFKSVLMSLTVTLCQLVR